MCKERFLRFYLLVSLFSEQNWNVYYKLLFDYVRSSAKLTSLKNNTQLTFIIDFTTKSP